MDPVKKHKSNIAPLRAESLEDLTKERASSSLPKSSSVPEVNLNKIEKDSTTSSSTNASATSSSATSSAKDYAATTEKLKQLTVQVKPNEFITPKRTSAYSPGGILSPVSPGNDYTYDTSLGIHTVQSETHDYEKAIKQVLKLYEMFKAKEYMRGWLYKKNDTLPDGKKFQSRDWMLYYVSHKGPVLTFWKAPDGVHLSAQKSAETGGLLEIENSKEVVLKLKKDLEPNFIKVSDSTVEWIGVFQKIKNSKTHKAGIYSLNTAGANRFFLQPMPTTNTKLKAVNERLDGQINQGAFEATDDEFLWANQDPAVIFLHHWVSSIKIASFEEGLLSQLYTDILLHCRNDLCVIERQMFGSDGKSEKVPEMVTNGYDLKKIAETRVEGYLQVRVAGTTEWKQYYCVVERRDLQGKHSPVEMGPDGKTLKVGKGHILFFESKKECEKVMKKSRFMSKQANPLKHALFEVIGSSAAHAVFPEKAELVNVSTIFKVEGGSLLLGAKAPKSFLQTDNAKFDFGQNVDYGLKKQTGQTLAPNFILCMAMTQAEMARWLFAIWSVFGLNGKGPTDFQVASNFNDPSIVSSMPQKLPSNCLSAKILTMLSLDPEDPLFLNLDDVVSLDMRSKKMDDYREKFFSIALNKNKDKAVLNMEKREKALQDAMKDKVVFRRPMSVFGLNEISVTSSSSSNEERKLKTRTSVGFTESSASDSESVKKLKTRSVFTVLESSGDSESSRKSKAKSYVAPTRDLTLSTDYTSSETSSSALKSSSSGSDSSANNNEMSEKEVSEVSPSSDENGFHNKDAEEVEIKERKEVLPRKQVQSMTFEKTEVSARKISNEKVNPSTRPTSKSLSLHETAVSNDSTKTTETELNRLEEENLKLKQEIEYLRSSGSQVGTSISYNPTMSTLGTANMSPMLQNQLLAMQQQQSIASMQQQQSIASMQQQPGFIQQPLNPLNPLVNQLNPLAQVQLIDPSTALLAQQLQVQQALLRQQQQQLQQQQQYQLQQQLLQSVNVLPPILEQQQYPQQNYPQLQQQRAQSVYEPQPRSQSVYDQFQIPSYQQSYLNNLNRYSIAEAVPFPGLPSLQGQQQSYGDRLPSPTPSESASALESLFLTPSQSILGLQPHQLQSQSQGLIANIPDKNTTRSTAYNPRTGVLQSRDQTRGSNPQRPVSLVNGNVNGSLVNGVNTTGSVVNTGSLVNQPLGRVEYQPFSVSAPGTVVSLNPQALQQQQLQLQQMQLQQQQMQQQYHQYQYRPQ